MTEIRDYNGSGEWSGPAIQERYLQHARSMGQKDLRDLTADQHFERSVRWVYHLLTPIFVEYPPRCASSNSSPCSLSSSPAHMPFPPASCMSIRAAMTTIPARAPNPCAPSTGRGRRCASVPTRRNPFTFTSPQEHT